MIESSISLLRCCSSHPLLPSSSRIISPKPLSMVAGASTKKIQYSSLLQPVSPTSKNLPTTSLTGGVLPAYVPQQPLCTPGLNRLARMGCCASGAYLSGGRTFHVSNWLSPSMLARPQSSRPAIACGSDGAERSICLLTGSRTLVTQAVKSSYMKKPCGRFSIACHRQGRRQLGSTPSLSGRIGTELAGTISLRQGIKTVDGLLE